MKDESTRRDFLRAAGLAVAGIAGASLFSRSAGAQEEEKEEEKEKKKEDEETEDSEGDLLEGGGSEEEETRACPQCGGLMYRQGRTWTCEICGYSYVE